MARSFPCIYYRQSEYFFQNENRDNFRHVSLELKTVVFDKKGRGRKDP